MTSASDADARQPKVEVCHLDADTGDFSLVKVATPAVDAHLAHGDGQPGEDVPGQNGHVFDEDCVPMAASEPVTEVCLDISAPFYIFDLTTDPETGALSGTCHDFDGNCALSGTAGPAPLGDVDMIDEISLELVNTNADQHFGGCNDGVVDKLSVTATRTDGGFSATFTGICDGDVVTTHPVMSGTLTEGACPTGRPLAGTSSVVLSHVPDRVQR